MMGINPAEHFRTIQPSILYFGTAVVLLTTLNEDGTTNITPMSSAWTLGNRLVLGLGAQSHGLANMLRHGECVVNLPDHSLWSKVERLAPLTGANPVPEGKNARHEQDKFAAAGLTATASARVRPDRVAECPLQIEATVCGIRQAADMPAFFIIEADAVQVHARTDLVRGGRHIDPSKWHPLIYNFRHYFGLDEQLGKTFKSET